MLVTQKCRYAIRALVSLARRNRSGPVKIAVVAEDQQIPIRFLEVILGQLKQGGFVESRRGTEGGYLLSDRPETIRVGDVVRFIDGRLGSDEPEDDSRDALSDLLRSAQQAAIEVFDQVTIAELRDRELMLQDKFTLNFEI